MQFKSKNSKITTDIIDYNGSNIVVDANAEFIANSAILNHSIISAGEKIVFAVKEVSCSSSTITAPHIYATNEANFANCVLNGEVHRDTIANVNKMLTPQQEIPAFSFSGSSFDPSGMTFLDGASQLNTGNIKIGKSTDDFMKNAQTKVDWTKELHAHFDARGGADFFAKIPANAEACIQDYAEGYRHTVECDKLIAEHSVVEYIE